MYTKDIQDSTTRSTIPWFQSLFNILSNKLTEVNISWIGTHKLNVLQETSNVSSVPMNGKKKKTKQTANNKKKMKM